MKRFPIHLCLALTALSLLAAVAPAHAEQRPFQADGSGSANLTGFGGPPSMLGLAEATHCGQSAVFFDVDREALESFGELGLLRLRLIAANGDVLIADIDADYDPSSGIVAGTVTFTGGTGRFTDATGGADLLIQFDASLRYFDFGLEGMIDY